MMFSLLLKKALPFTLTFVVGTALGGLTWLFGGSEKKGEATRVTSVYDFKRGCGPRHRRRLVAESKPLVILFKPDARLPLGAEPGQAGARPALVRVTFGADGKVQDAQPMSFRFHGRDESLVEIKALWESVERAARQIRFTPESVDGVPVTVMRDVEIRFLTD
jgi:hypothetical protein